MTSRDETDDSMTAQYLRLALFVLVVVLGGAIVLATVREGGEIESSISDYFHTPAQLAVVGVTLSIGVCLMALYSSNPVENFLLNTSGVFVPIVGFAATTQAEGAKAPFDFDVPTAHVDIFAETSVPAYFAALVLLALLVYVVHPVESRWRKAAMTMGAIVVLAVALWGIWSWEPRKVHVVAAIGFFLPLIVLVFATAATKTVPAPIRRIDWVIGSVMVISAVWYFLDRKFWKTEYATLVVETALVACFAVFWLVEYLRVAHRTGQRAAAGTSPP